MKCCLLLFHATTMNHFSMGLWCVTKKMDFIWQLAVTSSVAGPRNSSTALPKARLASEKVSRLLFAALLPIWSIKAFWIPVKPLHLRNTLSKSRCTEHCNACRRHWSTERVQFFSATTPDCTSHNQGFTSWTNRVLHSASSTRFTWPLALLTSSSISTFCRENASITRRTLKMLYKSSSNPEAWIFML